ncbi:PREDICTED: AP-4 complex accessory subunit tepsin [Nanorana parkeri]|uniref:AP-4 complex accessory subunit tepsin n=1 Tax=Nanorana parkeri TaxID=125878 RepID=UPI000854101A|nr:PREDICTED: AP-4 complex accessory subunit tepsin [Nanorana parkeri]
MALLDRLAFLHQLPVLLKGTSDDDTPCPGYLYEQIASILYYWSLGRPPSHPGGISLYKKVRSTAQELVSSLFTDVSPLGFNVPPAKEKSQTGMGSQVCHPHTMQGFGYSRDKLGSGTTGEALLSGIQRAVVAVTQAVLVGAGSQSPCPGDQADNAYKPVAVPPGVGQPSAEQLVPSGARSNRGCHRSGVPGGGWDDSDSGHSSQDSAQDKSSRSLSSDAASKTGSDCQSRSSNRESADPTDRVEPSHPGDCLQEAQLVLTVTRGDRMFLTQEEVQHFIRGSSLLNCEVVFEMLNRSLEDDNACVKLRSMCAIASLMTSDLLSHDHMLAVVRSNLQKLSGGPAGPVMDKARKILLQFEALTGHSPKGGASRRSLLPALPQLGPLDLLNDIVPQSEAETLLAPSSAPPSPFPELGALTPAHDDCGASVPEEGQVTDSETSAPGEHPGPRHYPDAPSPNATGGPLSLFDGMDLVTQVRSSVKAKQAFEAPVTKLHTDSVTQQRTGQPCLS